MKIFALTKRQTTGRDIIDDQFGRIFELVSELGQIGHDIKVSCLSYQDKPEVKISSQKSRVSWQSFNSGPIKLFGFIQYAFQSYFLAKKFKPDIIVCFSDTMYVILGKWIADRLQIKCVCDLQDNYEAYASAKIPGVMALFRRVVKGCAGVICVSEGLKEFVSRKYGCRGNVLVLVNGIAPQDFYPMDKKLCREKFNLPQSSILIGIAGALNKDRGVQILTDGFQKLRASFKDLHLVLAGPRDLEFPVDSNIHDLGIIDHKKVPILINALDVAIICNKDSAQYTFGFPTKAYEIMACHVPVVATNLGPMQTVLKNHPECLFDQDDVDGFVRVVSNQITNPSKIGVPVLTWTELALRFNQFIKTLK